MDSEREDVNLVKAIHTLAWFYHGTSIVDFKNMTILELQEAVASMERINNEQKKAMKRGV